MLLACRQWDPLGLAQRLPSLGVGAWRCAPLLPWRVQCPVRVCAALAAGSRGLGRYLVLAGTDHQSLQSWHKEHVDTPSCPASRRARWHETLAKFDLTVVYVPGKDNTVADCLSRWAYSASKGMTDVSAHGNEAETAEAKKIIEIERLMEEEGVKCFVVMSADAPLGTRIGRVVRVLAPEGAESDKHLFPESCLQDDWTDDYAKF